MALLYDYKSEHDALPIFRCTLIAKYVQPTQSHIQLRTQNPTDVFEQIIKYILSVMARSEKDKYKAQNTYTYAQAA